MKQALFILIPAAFVLTIIIRMALSPKRKPVQKGKFPITDAWKQRDASFKK